MGMCWETCSLSECIAQQSFCFKYFFQLLSFLAVVWLVWVHRKNVENFTQNGQKEKDTGVKTSRPMGMCWETCSLSECIAQQSFCFKYFFQLLSFLAVVWLVWVHRKNVENFTQNGQKEKDTGVKTSRPPSQGLEPWTTRLRALRSTNWARTAPQLLVSNCTALLFIYHNFHSSEKSNSNDT